MATINQDINENNRPDESLPVCLFYFKLIIIIQKKKNYFFLKIEDHQIISMSVKELNTLLKSMKPNDAANIKRRRRILKNKGYAASSRHRQTSLVGNLSHERSQLLKQVNERCFFLICTLCIYEIDFSIET